MKIKKIVFILSPKSTRICKAVEIQKRFRVKVINDTVGPFKYHRGQSH